MVSSRGCADFRLIQPAQVATQRADPAVSSILTAGVPNRVMSVPVTDQSLTQRDLTGSSVLTPDLAALRGDVGNVFGAVDPLAGNAPAVTGQTRVWLQGRLTSAVGQKCPSLAPL